MGLVLFPGDGDDNSPDVSWSYGGFAAFRQLLAQAEGIALSEMRGFGCDGLWNEVSTVLEPLLDHPEDGGDDLTPADCAAIVPRLEAIAEEWAQGSSAPLLRQAEVLRLCLEKDVPLLFL